MDLPCIAMNKPPKSGGGKKRLPNVFPGAHMDEESHGNCTWAGSFSLSTAGPGQGKTGMELASLILSPAVRGRAWG